MAAMLVGANQPITPLRTVLVTLSAVEIAALALFLYAAAPEIARRLGRRRYLFVYGTIGLGGLIAPGVIAAVTAEPIALLCASMLALGGALASRHYLIILPHHDV
jgi:membrane associated rhomboid family serine protease